MAKTSYSGGEDDPKKKKAAPPREPSELEKKYGPYMAGRESDVNILSRTPKWGSPDTQTAFRDRFARTAKQYDIRPELLFASTAEEGFREIFSKDTWSGDKEYPVAGFESFGLDYFSDEFPSLVQKGLLPADFKNNFKRYDAKNEKNVMVPSADFRTLDDAITAKAAMLASRRERVDQLAKEKNLTLSPKARDFFTLVNYNATSNTLPQMLDDYSKGGYLENDAFLKARPTVGRNGVTLSDKSYKDVYDHAMHRMVPADAWASYFTNPEQAGQAVQTARETNAAAAPAARPKTININVNGESTTAELMDGRYMYKNKDGDLTEYKSK